MSLELLCVFCNQRDAGKRGEALRHQMQSRAHSGWEWRDCVPGDIMRRWAGNFAGWHSYLYCGRMKITSKLVAKLLRVQDSWYSMKGWSWSGGRLSEIQGVAKSKSLGSKLVLVFKRCKPVASAGVRVREEMDSISTSGRVRLVNLGHVRCM